MPNVILERSIISPDLVREIRQQLGLSEGELAAEAGLTEAEVRKFEDGRRVPVRTAALLRRALANRGAVFPVLE